MPGHPPVHWVLRDVVPGSGYTLESDLEGAVLVCEWAFRPTPDGGTRLTQRIGVRGNDAEARAEGVRSAFGPTLAEGMKRIARQIGEAARR